MPFKLACKILLQIVEYEELLEVNRNFFETNWFLQLNAKIELNSVRERLIRHLSLFRVISSEKSEMQQIYCHLFIKITF